MSDEGATGGEIYTVSRAGGTPRDLTPGRASTPSWFSWRSNSEFIFTEFVGGSSQVSSLDVASGKTRRLWLGGETIQASDLATSLSLSNQGTAAFVRTSWSMLPEVWAGPLDHLQQVTRVNAGIKMPLPRSDNVTWTSGGFPVQGWLLYPSNYDPAAKSPRKYPMIVSVHGGPAWISTPAWKDEDFNAPLFTNLGYFVLVPNVRGSYGQGEKFTQANRPRVGIRRSGRHDRGRRCRGRALSGGYGAGGCDRLELRSIDGNDGRGSKPSLSRGRGRRRSRRHAELLRRKRDR